MLYKGEKRGLILKRILPGQPLRSRTLEWNPKETLNETLNWDPKWNPKETLNETLKKF